MSNDDTAAISFDELPISRSDLPPAPDVGAAISFDQPETTAGITFDEVGVRPRPSGASPRPVEQALPIGPEDFRDWATFRKSAYELLRLEASQRGDDEAVRARLRTLKAKVDTLLAEKGKKEQFQAAMKQRAVRPDRVGADGDLQRLIEIATADRAAQRLKEWVDAEAELSLKAEIIVRALNDGVIDAAERRELDALAALRSLQGDLARIFKEVQQEFEGGLYKLVKAPEFHQSGKTTLTMVESPLRPIEVAGSIVRTREELRGLLLEERVNEAVLRGLMTDRVLTNWVEPHLREEYAAEHAAFRRFDSAVGDLELARWQLLWSLGETRVRVGRVLLASASDLHARSEQEISAALTSGLLQTWLKEIRKGDESARSLVPLLDVTERPERVARAIRYTLGHALELTLGGRPTRLHHRNELAEAASRDLGTFDQLVAAFGAPEGTLVDWLRAQGVSSQECAKAAERRADARALLYRVVQGWRRGLLAFGLEDAVPQPSSTGVVLAERDAIVACIRRSPDALKRAVADGAHVPWLPADKAKFAAELTSFASNPLVPAIRVAHALMRLSGWYGLVFPASIAVSPEQFVGAADRDIAWATKLIQSGTVADWLKLNPASTEEQRALAEMTERPQEALLRLLWRLGYSKLVVVDTTVERLDELRDLCDAAPEKVLQFLGSGMLRPWLEGRGRPDLAALPQCGPPTALAVPVELAPSLLAEALGAEPATLEIESDRFDLVAPAFGKRTIVLRARHSGRRGRTAVRFAPLTIEGVETTQVTFGPVAQEWRVLGPGEIAECPVDVGLTDGARVGAYEGTIQIHAPTRAPTVTVHVRKPPPLAAIFWEVAAACSILLVLLLGVRFGVQITGGDALVDGRGASLRSGVIEGWPVWRTGWSVVAVGLLGVVPFWPKDAEQKLSFLGAGATLGCCLGWIAGFVVLWIVRALDAPVVRLVWRFTEVGAIPAILVGWSALALMTGLVVGGTNALSRHFGPLFGAAYGLVCATLFLSLLAVA